MNILREGIEKLRQSDKDIDCLFCRRAEEIISLLERYIKEIELFNEAYGLVGANNTDELIIKHILDCLAPLGIICRLLEHGTAQICDAGSGAGLPGIPLAITLPQCNFTLVERMGRRAGFLLNTSAVLELSNIKIEEKEIEKTSGQFNLVTFRAFKPLEPKLFKTLSSLCAPSGIIAAYKGRREKIEEEMAALEINGGSWEAIPCQVPFLEEERHLLIIK